MSESSASPATDCASPEFLEWRARTDLWDYELAVAAWKEAYKRGKSAASETLCIDRDSIIEECARAVPDDDWSEISSGEVRYAIRALKNAAPQDAKPLGADVNLPAVAAEHDAIVEDAARLWETRLHSATSATPRKTWTLTSTKLPSNSDVVMVFQGDASHTQRAAYYLFGKWSWTDPTHREICNPEAWMSIPLFSFEDAA